MREVPLVSSTCLWSLGQRKPLMTAFLEEWMASVEEEEKEQSSSWTIESLAANLTLLKLLLMHFGAKASR